MSKAVFISTFLTVAPYLKPPTDGVVDSITGKQGPVSQSHQNTTILRWSYDQE